MRALFGDAWGSGAERRMVEAHRNRMTTGTFTFAQPADPDAVQEHLQGSVARVRSAYAAGNKHEGTEQIIDALVDVAAAVTAERPSVSIHLTAWGAGRVRAVLRASADRASLDTQFAVRRALEAILAAWDSFSRYDPRAEAAEMGRAPAVADDTGGWRPA